MIIVANHQNALSDVIALCTNISEQLHWLTRADVFKKPSINKLLRSFNMLPVYRERDKVDDLSGINNKTFEECNVKLKNHQVLCVFPEGDHRTKKQLKPLKKGVARIAMNAMANGLEDLCIVPVGINHEHYFHSGGTILFNIGKPIPIKDFLNDESNVAKTQNQLLTSINTALKEVMIDIENDDIYEETIGIEALSNKLSGSRQPAGKFSFYKKTVRNISSQTSQHTKLKELADPYLRLQNELGINEHLYSEKGFSFAEYIFLFTGAIPAMIATLFFWPLEYQIGKLAKKLVKEPIFTNTIRSMAWTFLTPFYLLVSWAILSVFLGFKWSLITLLALCLTGVITIHWRKLYKRYKHYTICKKLISEKNKHFNDWITIREELKKFIIQLNQE